MNIQNHSSLSFGTHFRVVHKGKPAYQFFDCHRPFAPIAQSYAKFYDAKGQQHEIRGGQTVRLPNGEAEYHIFTNESASICRNPIETIKNDPACVDIEATELLGRVLDTAV